MLPQAQRFDLRSHPSFFTTARKFFFPLCTIFLEKKEGASQGALIIPKKVLAGSVQRNAMKRKLRVLLSPTLLQHSGNIVVIVVKRKFGEKDYLWLEEKLRQVLSQS
jgi:ribonuclease P protein component